MSALDQILHKMPNGSGKATVQSKMITLRIPPTLHAALKQEAKELDTSLNKLAIAKLSIKSELLDRVVEDLEDEDVPVVEKARTPTLRIAPSKNGI